MIYLASPYSHPEPTVRQARYEAALAYSNFAFATGRLIFSPIVYGHPFAEAFDTPTTHDHWAGFNEEILRMCSLLTVLKLPGWHESVGVNAEMELAWAINVPVTFAEPLE